MKIGDVVQLKDEIYQEILPDKIPDGRENNDTAVIQSIDIKTGAISLDRDLGGMKFWNKDDLRVVVYKRNK